MVKKRGRKFQFNLSNRFLYTFIAIAVIISLGIVVYALAPGVAPNPGHTLSEVAPPAGCTTGQVLSWSGSAWSCVSVTGGSGGGLRTYIGNTPSIYTGNIGGYSVANLACNNTFSGSRMCMAADFINGQPTSKGWYSTFEFVPGPSGHGDCFGWRFEGGGDYGAVWDAISSPSRPTNEACSLSNPITCCL